MKRLILYIILLFFLSGCYETKKEAYTSRRGLMLMEKHEYARNQNVYKPSNVKKKIQKNIHKKIKQEQRKKR